MHERSPKSSAIDTLLYEGDMLRHCAKTVDAKRARFQASHADEDAAEYYLGIEGFLLHMRNILGFFINKGSKPTDLTIGRPERWGDAKTVDDCTCRNLSERAKRVNNEHGLNGHDCYQKISWFLQHCTTYRHCQARSWDIDRMFADMEPILNDFVRNFAPAVSGNGIRVLSGEGHSTATVSSAVHFGADTLTVASEIPTSRKGREKWGTPGSPQQ
jgi:hypothetical protein